ncbi:sodium:calcium antiporter [Nitrospira sp. M1]
MDQLTFIIDSSKWNLSISLFVFGVSAILIAIFGYRLTVLADHLADRTGLGEALTGAFLLGAMTSLPEISTTVTAAVKSHAQLAVSNALGGIAAQSVFLVLADFTYRRANLEHAAASIANLMQGTLAIVLIAFSIMGSMMPKFQGLLVHPITPLMFGAYFYGLYLVFRVQSDPMWRPRQTSETREDHIDELASRQIPLWHLWTKFIPVVLIVGLGGWLIAKSAIALSQNTGLSETIVGVLFTSISTSFPELVTTIVAVRQGALTLAVGGILGGNAFDSLLIAISDTAYNTGSIYHAISSDQIFLMGLTIIMTSILLMGLIRREQHGIVNIGFESFAILMLYVSGVVYLVLG